MHARTATAAGAALLLVAGSVIVFVTRPKDPHPGDSPGNEEPRCQNTLPDDSVGPQGPAWFHDVSQETGIDFRHNSGTSPEKPFPAANGSGVAVLDYDLDGNPDLYFASGTPFPLSSLFTAAYPFTCDDCESR